MKHTHFTKKIAAVVCSAATLATALFAPTALNASAYQYGDFTYDVSGGAAWITSCKDGMKNVYIPASISGLYASLNSNFSCKNIKNTLEVFELPNTNLNGIPACCFENCTKLKSVHLSKCTPVIQHGAFSGCTSLKQVHIPYGTVQIDHGAFAGAGNTDFIVHNPDTPFVDTTAGIAYTAAHKPYTGTIYAAKGSLAERYAKNNNYKFVDFVIGDVDGNNRVDAIDASKILRIYCGSETNVTKKQMIAADVNQDGYVDSIDASRVLAYYAAISTGDKRTLEQFSYYNYN